MRYLWTAVAGARVLGSVARHTCYILARLQQLEVTHVACNRDLPLKEVSLDLAQQLDEQRYGTGAR